MIGGRLRKDLAVLCDLSRASARILRKRVPGLLQRLSRNGPQDKERPVEGLVYLMMQDFWNRNVKPFLDVLQGLGSDSMPSTHALTLMIAPPRAQTAADVPPVWMGSGAGLVGALLDAPTSGRMENMLPSGSFQLARASHGISATFSQTAKEPRIHRPGVTCRIDSVFKGFISLCIIINPETSGWI